MLHKYCISFSSYRECKTYLLRSTELATSSRYDVCLPSHLVHHFIKIIFHFYSRYCWRLLWAFYEVTYTQTQTQTSIAFKITLATSVSDDVSAVVSVCDVCIPPCKHIRTIHHKHIHTTARACNIAQRGTHTKNRINP